MIVHSRKSEGGKMKQCPCGKYASKPGEHEGSCAWRNSRNAHPAFLGKRDLPTPSHLTPEAFGVSSTSNIKDALERYERITNPQDTSPSTNYPPPSPIKPDNDPLLPPAGAAKPLPSSNRKVAADGYSYVDLPLPQSDQPLRSDNFSDVPFEQLSSLALKSDNPYELHALAEKDVKDFIPGVTDKILKNPHTSLDTHELLYKKFKDNPLYEQAAAISLYTPETILKNISNKPNMTNGTREALINNTYTPQEIIQKVAKVDEKYETSARTTYQHQERIRSRQTTIGMRTPQTNMYRRLSR